MREFDRVIFAGKSGTCREPMAMELLKKQPMWHSVEVAARGIVVLFPEPINQKADAVMISNGIQIGKYMSSQLTSEDFDKNTLILAFDQETKEKILAMEGAQNVHVLTDVTGDELEILDPYGAELVMYGLCFETLTNTIKKLADVLNNGTYFDNLDDEVDVEMTECEPEGDDTKTDIEI